MKRWHDIDFLLPEKMKWKPIFRANFSTKGLRSKRRLSLQVVKETIHFVYYRVHKKSLKLEKVR